MCIRDRLADAEAGENGEAVLVGLVELFSGGRAPRAARVPAGGGQQVHAPSAARAFDVVGLAAALQAETIAAGNDANLRGQHATRYHQQ